MKAVIALGANLGDPRENIARAVDALRAELSVEAVSKIIETEPVDAPGQANYLNGVLIAEVERGPVELLHLLQRIEREGGRVRTARNAPRTIDLDLIAYGDLVMDTPELTLPHPRAYRRRFVLEPWLSIDPRAELPGHGTVEGLLEGLDPEGGGDAPAAAEE